MRAPDVLRVQHWAFSWGWSIFLRVFAFAVGSVVLEYANYSLTLGLLHLLSPLPEMLLPSARGVLCTLISFRSLSAGWPAIPLECEPLRQDMQILVVGYLRLQLPLESYGF